MTVLAFCRSSSQSFVIFDFSLILHSMSNLSTNPIGSFLQNMSKISLLLRTSTSTTLVQAIPSLSWIITVASQLVSLLPALPYCKLATQQPPKICLKNLIEYITSLFKSFSWCQGISSQSKNQILYNPAHLALCLMWCLVASLTSCFLLFFLLLHFTHCPPYCSLNAPGIFPPHGLDFAVSYVWDALS